MDGVGTVKLLIADIQLAAGKEEQILSQIAPRYAEKYLGTKLQKDARQELMSGYLLWRYLGISRNEQLTYNEYEKPFLVSGDSFFNLSHSEDCVVLAIADSSVGIDVEQIRSCHEATVKKVFTAKQKEELHKLEAHVRDEKFTEIWTTCEAVLKLKGTGFGETLDMEKEMAECHLYTTKIADYFLSCATEKQAEIVMENIKNIEMETII